MTLADLPVLLVGALAIALLVHVAWYDFWHLTIRNGAVLVLLALYALWAALTGFSSFTFDLASAVILFLPGFAMWLMRLMGGGDVKLYFALGLFMGLSGLLIFALLLLGISAVFLILLRVARLIRSDAKVVDRLRQIHASGKAPYAVIMSSAAIPVIFLRFFVQA